MIAPDDRWLAIERKGDIEVLGAKIEDIYLHRIVGWTEDINSMTIGLVAVGPNIVNINTLNGFIGYVHIDDVSESVFDECIYMNDIIAEVHSEYFDRTETK